MADDKMDKILAAVVHIKDKIDNKMVTREDFDAKHDGLLTHIDGFIKLHETLDQELVSLRHKYDRLEGWIKTIAEKTGVELPE